jgi:hypothetical protein
MKTRFKKVKMEHHIITDFTKFLLEIEKNPDINRIIPGRISRQQKWSSAMRFKITIPTNSWFKCIMSKWSTAQELFIVCQTNKIDSIKEYILKNVSLFKLK